MNTPNNLNAYPSAESILDACKVKPGDRTAEQNELVRQRGYSESVLTCRKRIKKPGPIATSQYLYEDWWTNKKLAMIGQPPPGCESIASAKFDINTILSPEEAWEKGSLIGTCVYGNGGEPLIYHIYATHSGRIAMIPAFQCKFIHRTFKHELSAIFLQPDNLPVLFATGTGSSIKLVATVAQAICSKMDIRDAFGIGGKDADI